VNVSNELTLVSNGYGVCLLNLPIFEQPKNLQSYLLSVIKFLAEHCMHDTTLELCSEFEWLMIDEEFRFDEDIQNKIIHSFETSKNIYSSFQEYSECFNADLYDEDFLLNTLDYMKTTQDYKKLYTSAISLDTENIGLFLHDLSNEDNAPLWLIDLASTLTFYVNKDMPPLETTQYGHMSSSVLSPIGFGHTLDNHLCKELHGISMEAEDVLEFTALTDSTIRSLKINYEFERLLLFIEKQLLGMPDDD